MAKDEFTELAEVVFDHLASIQDALRDYQTSEGAQTSSVSRELQLILNRVRSIELEADRTREMLAAAKHKSNHDELTGLANRAAFNERAFHELRRFKRYHRPLSLAVCDVDYFKKINDRFGHTAGDKSLRLLAKYIAAKLRSVDFIARLGGEEFVLILPETNEAQAKLVLDKIRNSVSQIPFKFNKKPIQITVSFGISELTINDTMEMVFERADKALYAAKASGRNQCCIESASPQTHKMGNVRRLSNVVEDSLLTPSVSMKKF